MTCQTFRFFPSGFSMALQAPHLNLYWTFFALFISHLLVWRSCASAARGSLLFRNHRSFLLSVVSEWPSGCRGNVILTISQLPTRGRFCSCVACRKPSDRPAVAMAILVSHRFVSPFFAVLGLYGSAGSPFCLQLFRNDIRRAGLVLKRGGRRADHRGCYSAPAGSSDAQQPGSLPVSMMLLICESMSRHKLSIWIA